MSMRHVMNHVKSIFRLTMLLSLMVVTFNASANQKACPSGLEEGKIYHEDTDIQRNVAFYIEYRKGENGTDIIDKYNLWENGKPFTKLTCFVGTSRTIEVGYTREGDISWHEEKVDGHRVGMYLNATTRSYIEKTYYDRNGKKDGVATVEKDGVLISSATWVHGEKTGPMVNHARSGNRIQGTYQDGELVGDYQEFDDQGLVSSINYDHGMKNGPYFRTISRDPDLRESGHYIDDKKDGPWSEYLFQRQYQGHYDNGVKVGRWELSNLSGHLIGIQHYDYAGKKTGPWLHFLSNGQLVRCEFYENDTRSESHDREDERDFMDQCRTMIDKHQHENVTLQ